MASVSISCPSCSATDGVVRNGKSTAGHQRYLCSHCRKVRAVMHNLNLRQHLARLGRKSLSFSNRWSCMTKSVGHYLEQ
ncbi:Transposase (plasmid) [Shigella dysenteriae 1617]|uniref:Transposase n=1 Tax=Shigella dysenteriae 1617 TaxID=754093 RepID=A0A0A7A4I9_SHIDY|nr:Transposase [Shigella dysenteriae 1617]